jgi:citrate/tricarballylate utilization protein
VGGVSLMMGTAGLWMLNRAATRCMATPAKAHGPGLHRPAVPGGRSGLALWLGRGTPALALLLCLHLGAVMALFATLPYGKFAHGVFRTAALLRHNTEKRQPSPIGLGAD